MVEYSLDARGVALELVVPVAVYAAAASLCES